MGKKERGRGAPTQPGRECRTDQPEDVSQPDTHTFIRKIANGFRLRTFMALHKCIDRFREKDALPEVKDILLALIPLDWERINRHVPRNSDVDQGVEDRPWKEWASAEA